MYTKFEKIDFPGLLNIDVVHSVNIIWKKTASRLDLDQHSILLAQAVRKLFYVADYNICDILATN